MSHIYDLSFEELKSLLAGWGEPQYRTQQLWQGLYRGLAASFDEITPLPSTLRARLAEMFQVHSLTPHTVMQSSDGGTRKVLFTLPDGYQIETVIMRYHKRRTACISTQAGCALGCVFCATGQMGFDRHLSVGEIVEQVFWLARELRAEDDRLTNIVVMGMGEPFHNYDATMGMVNRLTDAAGFNFGARRITISTVGLIPMIERFTALNSQVNLAVSLHAATDALRTELIPINKRYPLAELMAACRNYVAQTRRRITFEWALIQDVNDSPEQAQALVGWLRGLNCHVNLIPLNPTHEYALVAASRERAEAFRAVLFEARIPCTIRVRRGIDINAGCGQLRTAVTEITLQN